jgi:hypothetical protein
VTKQTEFALPQLLIQTVVDLLDFRERSFQSEVVDLLRAILTKIDLDARFQNEQIKTQIATMFFPLFPEVCKLGIYEFLEMDAQVHLFVRVT